jgi:hypothetical protein
MTHGRGFCPKDRATAGLSLVDQLRSHPFPRQVSSCGNCDSPPGFWVLVAGADRAAAQVGGSLSAVSCSSASACMGVGTTAYPDSTSAQLMFAERWNGHTWIARPVSVDMTGFFTGISCPSRSFCVAVGSYGPPLTRGPMWARWDGAAWTVASMPEPTGATLRAAARRVVWCAQRVCGGRRGTPRSGGRPVGRGELEASSKGRRCPSGRWCLGRSRLTAKHPRCRWDLWS